MIPQRLVEISRISLLCVLYLILERKREMNHLKQKFLTFIVQGIPMRVWLNLGTPSQKNVFKCIK